MKFAFRYILLLLWFGFGTLYAQHPNPRMVISVLTCSPGDELYSIYGHNALRVVDYETGTDLVYNYGTFDFNTQGFALKFMRGQLPYLLSVARYDDFMYEYEYFNRSVSEQILNIDSTATEKIATFLKINMLPENRAYKYDFFKDNCATRIRDVLDHNIAGLQWDKAKASGKTYRQIIKEYQWHSAWTDFGIDLIIGAPADTKTTLAEEVFIPDYLAKAMTSASITGTSPQNLELNQRTLLTFDDNKKHTFFLLTPEFFFSVLLFFEMLVLTYYYEGKRMKYMDLYDKIWAVILTLAGLLMLFMWFGTDHIPTKYNWNILWANLLIPFWYFYGKYQKWSGALATIILVCLLLSVINALPFMRILPQYFHPVVSIIATILIIKGWRVYKLQINRTYGAQ